MKERVDIKKTYGHLKNYDYFIGVDEVGWGAGAGPMWVGAALMWNEEFYEGDSNIKDSKAYSTEKVRGLALSEFNYDREHDYANADVSVEDIVTLAPFPALFKAINKVCEDLRTVYPNSLVIVDGNRKVPGLQNHICVPRADATIPVVSAASCHAKLIRDVHMTEELGEKYPEYEFHKNKGYLTPDHLEILNRLGPTKHHRIRIERVSKALEKHGYYEDRED